MAEVVLFHHAQGLTPGVVAFADELRRAGHTVHTPDLFEGRTFSTIDEGMRHAEEIGFPGEVIGRGVQAVDGLPTDLIYAGFMEPSPTYYSLTTNGSYLAGGRSGRHPDHRVRRGR